MPGNASWAVTVTIALLTLTIMGVVGSEMAALDGEQFDDRVQWCEEHGGEAVISHAIDHGGLHCQFGNGTMVHMGEIESFNNSQGVVA